jgi:hypothetical protein
LKFQSFLRFSECQFDGPLKIKRLPYKWGPEVCAIRRNLLEFSFWSSLNDFVQSFKWGTFSNPTWPSLVFFLWFAMFCFFIPHTPPSFFVFLFFLSALCMVLVSAMAESFCCFWTSDRNLIWRLVAELAYSHCTELIQSWWSQWVSCYREVTIVHVTVHGQWTS